MITFGSCLLILIVLIILAGLNNKRKAIIREYNMRSLAENIQVHANNTSVNNIGHQPNTRSNFVIADNSAYNHDLPPSYETIVVYDIYFLIFIYFIENFLNRFFTFFKLREENKWIEFIIKTHCVKCSSNFFLFKE